MMKSSASNIRGKLNQIKSEKRKFKKKIEKKEKSKKEKRKKEKEFAFSSPGKNMRLFVFTLFLILSNA